MNSSVYTPRSLQRSLRRDRGPRGLLLSPEVPCWESCSEIFDQTVIDAYVLSDQRWSRQPSRLDITINTVPRIQLHPDMYFPEEIIADGPVPLGRLIPASTDRVGNPTRPHVVASCRPVERRISSRMELDQILQNVLTRLVVVYLGIDPVEVNPNFDENFLQKVFF